MSRKNILIIPERNAFLPAVFIFPLFVPLEVAMKFLLKKTILAGLPLVGILLTAPPAALAKRHHHHHCWRGDRYSYNYGRPSYEGSYYYGGSPYDQYGYGARPYYGDPYAYGGRPSYGGGPYANPYALGPNFLLPSLLGLLLPGY